MLNCQPGSSARVDLVAASNATFGDAIQFDAPVPGVTGPAWSLSGQKFAMDIDANHEQNTPLLSITSDAGQIVTDDVTERIIHFNVPDSVLQAALVPGVYVYDLIMYDTATPPVRVALMHGTFTLTDGVTEG